MIVEEKFQKMLEDFKVLEYEKQKLKVIDMLKGFKDFDEKYEKMLVMIQQDDNQKIPKEVFFDIYESIMVFGYEIERIENEESEFKFNKARKKIEAIKELEKNENIKDSEDADDLLLSI